MKGLSDAEVLLLFISAMAIFGFMWYSFGSQPTPSYLKKTGRMPRNVRYFCSTHFQEGRKEKEFVVIRDSKCELCKKMREAK